MLEPISDYTGYQRLPSWVLGFHGCDESVGKAILESRTKHLKPSDNSWDWLGTGIYFWENDPVRALQFAHEGMNGKVTKGKIEKPFVIGAIIDLGLCFNLFDQTALMEMSESATEMINIHNEFEVPLPKNIGGLRSLDRFVFENLHVERQLESLPPYQTVRANFPEGGDLYPGAGFCEKNHIQIAVRDPSVIRGYFLPRT